jgi:hypothetical protein
MHSRPILLLIFFAAVGLLGPGRAPGQQVRQSVIEPREARAIYGAVVTLPTPIPLYPLTPAAGTNRVFSTTVPRTRVLKLRFKVLTPAQSNTWYVRVSAARGVVDTHVTSPDGVSGFWSEEHDGMDNPTVEVYCFDENCALKLEIDAVAQNTVLSAEQAITKPPDVPQFKTYRGLGNPIKDWGRAVVRIRRADERDLFSCTGFLVSPDLLMTNHHCIPDERAMHDARVEFDFESQRPAASYKFKELVAANEDLDFALLRLHQRWVDRAPLQLAAADLTRGRNLIVIQHPKGLKKRVADEDCRLGHTDIINEGSNVATDFGHSCDTYGGSSGSPVQEAATGRVIGLHHFEFFPSDRILLNRAVKMSLIIDCLKGALGQSKPEVLGELNISTTPPINDFGCSPPRQ